MKRNIITIDESKCNGCGACVPDCPEGALRIIDGKARLVGDLFCDGLGACLGRCPEGAIQVEEREAADYDERAVMANIEPQGINVIKAHLEHLSSQGADSYSHAALEWLVEKGYDLAGIIETGAPKAQPTLDMARQQELSAMATVGSGSGHHDHEGGCPGSRAVQFQKTSARPSQPVVSSGPDQSESALSHWPVQMHLMNPRSPHFAGTDFLLAADCTAFSLAGFHPRLLSGKTLGIACPKLDTNKEIYVDKLVALIDEAKINTLTVAIMEVPCCGGLSVLAQEAASRAKRRVPIKEVVLSIEGGVMREEWI